MPTTVISITRSHPTTRTNADGAAGVPAALRSEWIKVSTVRTYPILLALTVLSGLVTSWATGTLVKDEVLFANEVFLYSTVLTAVFASITGILLFTSEAQHGTLAGVLTSQPARWVIVFSKSMLTRNSAAAISGLLVWSLVVENLLRQFSALRSPGSCRSTPGTDSSASRPRTTRRPAKRCSSAVSRTPWCSAASPRWRSPSERCCCTDATPTDQGLRTGPEALVRRGGLIFPVRAFYAHRWRGRRGDLSGRDGEAERIVAGVGQRRQPFGRESEHDIPGPGPEHCTDTHRARLAGRIDGADAQEVELAVPIKLADEHRLGMGGDVATRVHEVVGLGHDLAIDYEESTEWVVAGGS